MGAYTIEERKKGYLLFTITRNEKRNAINYEVMEGLEKAIELSKSFGIKALIITGSGDHAFCSGGDLSVFHLLKTEQEAYPMLSKMAAILFDIATLPIPTVALMNGVTIGGGLELASACDFRIARSDIKAGFVQGKQAITTGWGGASLLSEKLPAATAMKLLMKAEMQTARQLHHIGFIDELYSADPIDACEAFLEKMLAIESSVLGAYKEIWVRKWAANRLQERIEEEVKRCSILWESDAHHSYVKNFVAKKQNKL